MGKRERYEQETVINYNQEEDYAICYTHDAKLMRKLDKMCSKSSIITVKNEGEGSKTYTFPKKWIKVQFPREVSEEMRVKLADRARANFHNKGES